MNNIKIYFFTGASGAGKTELINALAKENLKSSVIFLHFDNIGVPSEEEMIKEYGSGSEWQRAMTHIWLEKILSKYNENQVILFEGQVNLDFIKEACANKNFTNYKIILVHCDNVTRHKRLAKLRNQLELINSQMDNWANYLHNQAIEQKAMILDTSNRTLNELVSWCKKNLNV